MISKTYKCLNLLGSYIPLILLFGIFTFIYLTYLGTYLYPLLSNSYDMANPKESSVFQQFNTSLNLLQMKLMSFIMQKPQEQIKQSEKGTTLFIILHCLIILWVFSTFQTMFKKPGEIPKEWLTKTEEELNKYFEIEQQVLAKMKQEGSKYSGQNNEDEEVNVDDDEMHKITHVALMTIMERENKRFCQHCQNFKPPRTHHCKQCDKCILKMDHHCSWVYNCVGFQNYKFFVLMLIYTDSLLLFISITYTSCVIDSMNNEQIDVYLKFLIFLVYVLSLTLGLILISFTFFHFWLLLRGKTTLEYCEKKRGKKGTFDRGLQKNFLDVFGGNFLLWFFPIDFKKPQDGLNFKEQPI